MALCTAGLLQSHTSIGIAAVVVVAVTAVLGAVWRPPLLSPKRCICASIIHVH